MGGRHPAQNLHNLKIVDIKYFHDSKQARFKLKSLWMGDADLFFRRIHFQGFLIFELDSAVSPLTFLIHSTENLP
jgi:hypothetical protein